MLHNLFSSKARIRILELLLFNAAERFYQRQISSLTKLPILSVQREMQKLENIGLVNRDISGNRIYYIINKSCPIFEDLKKIFLKTMGIARVFKEELKKSHDIVFAFIYGSYVRGEEDLTSDIDLMIVGDISSRSVSGLLSEPKIALCREINYAIFTLKEFRQKLQIGDHFIKSIVREKKIFIMGRDDEFKKIFGK